MSILERINKGPSVGDLELEIERLTAVKDAAEKCKHGCRRCNGIDDRYWNLKAALAAVDKGTPDHYSGQKKGEPVDSDHLSDSDTCDNVQCAALIEELSADRQRLTAIEDAARLVANTPQGVQLVKPIQKLIKALAAVDKGT